MIFKKFDFLRIGEKCDRLRQKGTKLYNKVKERSLLVSGQMHEEVYPLMEFLSLLRPALF